MKKKIYSALFLAFFLAFFLTMAGCSNHNNSTEPMQTGAENSTDSGNSTSENPATIDTAQIFSDRDFQTEYDESASAAIQLNGSSATCSSNAVQIAGSTVKITDEGTYILSGTLDDGMIIVDADKSDKIQLVLNNVNIHSKTCAPIYILQSDKVFITMAAGVTNTLSNGGTFTAIDEDNIDAVIFSKEDVTLNGTGTLVITSPAGHGIVSKDSLKITGGSYDINCSSQAVLGKDDVCIANADFAITSGKDGIHADNEDDASLGYVYIQSGTFHISAAGDGISASSCLQIEDGGFDITAGGGSVNAAAHNSDFWGEFTIDSADDSFHSNGSLTVNGGTLKISSGDDAFHADETLTITDGNIHISKSYEGLEGQNINISGGDITLTASDDGVNAAGGNDSSGNTGGRDGMFGDGKPSSGNGTITISGGILNVTASGDGIDANGSFDITGGDITITGPTQGDTAILDYDATGTISGGTFIGTGASGRMAQTFSDFGQGVVTANIGTSAAGTQIKLSDSKGNILFTHTPNLDFALVIFSSPDIISGGTYTLTAGTSSSEFTAG